MSVTDLSSIWSEISVCKTGHLRLRASACQHRTCLKCWNAFTCTSSSQTYVFPMEKIGFCNSRNRGSKTILLFRLHCVLQRMSAHRHFRDRASYCWVNRRFRRLVFCWISTWQRAAERRIRFLMMSPMAFGLSKSSAKRLCHVIAGRRASQILHPCSKSMSVLPIRALLFSMSHVLR